MTTIEETFVRLNQSTFRSKFHLSLKDKEYVHEKGMNVIRSHCEDFIKERLAPSNPS